MDGKHFSLITIAMIILLGIVGLGFMQMNTNNTLSTIANRLMVVEKQVQQETVKTTSTTATTEEGAPCKGDCDAGVVEYKDYKWDFGFKYPEDASVVITSHYNGLNGDGLIITSKKGRLYRAGGAVSKPLVTEFSNGYEIIIQKAESGNSDLLLATSTKLSTTKNSLVQKLSYTVDGLGYPVEEYLITTKKGKYLLDVYFGEEEIPNPAIHQSYLDDVSSIIGSITE